jgi:hypothetical protein
MSDQPTRVVHINDQVPGAVYIGRANGRKRLPASPFANPFKIGPVNRMGAVAARRAAIDGFRLRLEQSPDLLRQLPDLRGKPLACWCRHDGEVKTAENACHGDILVELLERYSDEELRAMAKGAGS